MTTDTVQLAHGGGGRLSRELVEKEILTRFGNDFLAALPDAARLPAESEELIFTTDSFVVQPLEFAGGNIGMLAVHGTVNDIAVSGGLPKWLSLGLIVEEGLPLAVLRRILDAVKSAADDCSAAVVTGDTKVVSRGECDGIYINTSGIGIALKGFRLGPKRIMPGDHVIVSGPLGDHGMAVLSAREDIDVENGPQSDTGPVHRLVLAAQNWVGSVRFMRDPTRGGAAAVLNEAVENTSTGIMLRESDIPFSSGTRSVAELLGIDLLNVASEGRIIAICAPDVSRALLDGWRALPEGADAAIIGTVTSDPGRVAMETVTGGRRLVDVPQGELLPRIC